MEYHQFRVFGYKFDLTLMPAIGSHRVTNTMHPLGTTTACTNFQGNPFNSCAASMAMIKSRGGEMQGQ